MKKKLILLHTSQTASSIKNFLKDNDKAIWMYMGKDYDDMLAWDNLLSKIAKQVGYGKDLQSKALELRRPFLDFIAETAHQNEVFVRWSSSVFEKNSVGSPLFLYLCYLDMFKDCIHKHDADTLIVISESWSLISVIKDNYSSGDCKVIALSNINMPLSMVKSFINIAARPFLFIYRSLLEYFVSISTRKKSLQIDDVVTKSNNGKNIIIRTWVSDKFFDKNGNFKDAYFDGLSSWLTEQGYNVRILPVLVDTRIPIKKVVRLLRGRQDSFLIPWDYLKPIDIFRSLVKGVGQIRIKFSKKDFKGWNIEKLLDAERLNFALSGRGLNCILQYYLFERLSQKSVKIDRIIYTFENMLSEKLLIIAVRTFYPDSVIVGFQHSVLYPLHLTLYVSANEVGSAPLPDRIVCSGKLFKDVLAEEFYPEGILQVGPAMRFGYLFEKKHENKSYGDKVMMVLPGYKNEALYLLVKTLSALKDDEFTIHIKPHPLTDLNDVYKAVEKVSFPKNRIIIEKKMLQELMSQSAAMITVSSSVIYDAIAWGVPVIRVKKEIDLDLDPADWLGYDPARDFIAYTSDDIRSEVNRALALNGQERERLISYGSKFVESSFSPVNNKMLNMFLN
ncbi:MAG: hypothetical protein HY959_01375 [Ignavibacteriae bacterium]|nr:hypothetical protein [Ignavibacteriota bacterium]